MNTKILDSFEEIRNLDTKNMLASIQLLGKQLEQIWEQGKGIKVPADYKKIQNVTVFGMGGSALGAHIIKALYQEELKVPIEIVNGYHISGYVGKDSLVVISSYSGTTEEPLNAMREAAVKKAKLIVICAGGTLADYARTQNIPALIFDTDNNPCGSPRMGIGYSILGQMILLSKAGLFSLPQEKVKSVIEAIAKCDFNFGVGKLLESGNKAKEAAKKTLGRSIWYAASEHLSGNAHAAANQTNENAKRFAGYFLIPELNHHLMEGMMNPKSNRDNLLFILLESALYDARVQKRYQVSKEILKKNNIDFISYQCQEKDKFSQVAEVLVFGSYVSYYSALLEGIDPTAIPFVDYFKKELGK